MSDYVPICLNMSEHVGVCRNMSEHVGICRNMYTIFTYENYLYNRIFNSQIFFFGFFGNVCPHFFLIQKFFFGHHRVPCALICILSLIVGNWTSQKKNRTRQASVLSLGKCFHSCSTGAVLDRPRSWHNFRGPIFESESNSRNYLRYLAVLFLLLEQFGLELAMSHDIKWVRIKFSFLSFLLF